MVFHGEFYLAPEEDEQIEVLKTFDEDIGYKVLLIIDLYNRIEYFKGLCAKAELNYSVCFMQPGMKADSNKWIYMNDVFDHVAQDFIISNGGMVMFGS